MELGMLSLAWESVSILVLNLVLTLVIIIIGYLLARLSGFLVTYFLKLIQLDTLAKRAGFSQVLEKGDVRRSAAELCGDFIYWLILLLTILLIGLFFALPLQPALSKIFVFTGRLFIAAVALGIGLYLASLLSGIIKVISVNFGIEGGKTFSRIIYYIMVTFAFLAALNEIGISMEVFVPQIGVIIGAFGLAAAIAFGLGCKDMAADFLHNLSRGR